MHKHTKLEFSQINMIKSEYHEKYNTNRTYKKYCLKQLIFYRLTKNKFKFLINYLRHII